MYCPYCGNPCAEDHKFCFRCGSPLPEQPVPEPVPEAVLTADTTEEPAPAVAPPDCTDPVLPESEVLSNEPESPAEPKLPNGRLWPPAMILLVMICVGLAAFFWSGSTPSTERSCFSIENGVLYFDYSCYTGSDELTVPEMVNGMAVTAIADGCFRDCDRLTTIILPETVTVIGADAFAGCDSLRGIYLPEGLLSIGTSALSDCPALEAVYFPASVTEIGAGCLDNCESLQYILYDGTYAQWIAMYEGHFPSGMELHTDDGVYYAQP